ncbi:MAG: hypothetical protein IKU06_06525 [Lachnospiraceae bacterium]|nr:hypothetical protein [Lachnospiraceae bacterium]
MIEIKYGQLRKIAFIILALPFLVFLIGWLKWYWSIVCVAALGVCLYFAIIRDDPEYYFEEHTIEVSWPVLFAIMAIALIWVWQSGIGGFWTQSTDFRYRNAIYRDIVVRDWPVIYPATGHALVYYIGYWLFPAVFGKLVLLAGAEENTAFAVANTALFIWTFFIVMIVFFLILYTLKLSDRKKQLLMIGLFIFFSGADIIGNVGYTWKSINYHFEWWATDYQFSSFTTCLFWVFNQALPAWACFMCIMNEKSIRNYVFLGMMCLFCAPLPFVGLFVFCVYFAIKKLREHIKQGETKEYIKSIFSVSNILGVLVVFPVIGTYLLSSVAIQGAKALRVNDAAIVMEDSGAGTENAPFSDNPIINYISFVCIEFALYMIFMAWKYKKSAVYYVTFASLLIIPLLKIGGKNDFSMRASIPALIMVFLLVAKFLMDEKKVLKEKGSVKKMTYIMLVVFLILGTLTPAMEFLRGFHEVSEYGIHNEKYDDIYTLGCDGPYDQPGKKKTYANFVAVNPEEKVFFKVFGKKTAP